MCEDYTPCITDHPKLRKKIFNMLLLDCWQREYDKRPYRHFVFKRLEFEARMRRRYNPMKDFAVIINFLHNRKLDSVSIYSVNASHNLELELDFAAALFNLRRLELRLMQLPESFFDQLVANVKKMHLQELILEGTKLSYFQIIDLRLFLIESSTMRFLNVACCDIDQFNFSFVADGVHKSTTMRRFNFNRLVGNSLTLDSQKIAHTVSCLVWQNKLEELEMRKCEFVAQDMEVIAEYMWSKYSKLRKLDVSDNIIGSDGAEYIFKAVVHSGTLTHLNMSNCSLGSHGGDVIAKYLSSCFHLEYLDITFNNISSEAINNMLTMMKKRIKTLSLRFYGNKFDVRTGDILHRLLKARVVPQDAIDVTVTCDDGTDFFRIVPYY